MEGFERYQAAPCVSRRALCKKVVVIIVVYASDLLVASATKRNEKQALTDNRSFFHI